jgi:anti-anti-sigma regulatory factor
MAFSGSVRLTGDSMLRIDLVGEIRDDECIQLQRMILRAIIDGEPDELLVDLERVTALSFTALFALVRGYVVAVEWAPGIGSSMRRGQVDRKLRATSTLDVLADSDDPER